MSSALVRQATRPTVSGEGGACPSHLCQKGLLADCSKALRLPNRKRNITAAERITTDVGILALGRLSMIESRCSCHLSTFLA